MKKLVLFLFGAAAIFVSLFTPLTAKADPAPPYWHWIAPQQIEYLTSTSQTDYSYDSNTQLFVGQSSNPPQDCSTYVALQPPASGQQATDPSKGVVYTTNKHGSCTSSDYTTQNVELWDSSLADKSFSQPPTSSDNNCQDNSGSYAWVVCSAYDLVNKASSSIFTNIIVPFLEVTPLNNNHGLQQIWQSFRDLANAFFVLIFLIIIFANIASINIDSYTIKKMLPRLVAAVVLVQFSYLICSILVDVGNVLGDGISALIASALQVSTTGQPAGTSIVGYILLSLKLVALLAGIGLGVALIKIKGPILLVPAITVLIAIVVFFVTLVLRQMAIVTLVALSPIAFAAWILPNTEQFYKFWWKNLIKLILMYPLIVLLIGMAKVVDATSGGTDNPIQGLVSFFAPTLAFLAIPATFRMAGGIMTGAAALTAGRIAKPLQGKARNSQMAKDLRQGQTEKGFMNAASSNSKVGRFLGRAQAGVYVPTAVGQRRLASGYASTLDTQGKQYQDQYTALREKLGGDDKAYSAALESIAKGKDSWEYTNDAGEKISGKHGVKINDAAKAAAIQTLADHKKFDELRSVKEQVGGNSQLWQVATRSKIGDFMSAAPDLVRGNSAFDSLNADQISNLHSSTAQRMVDYINGPEASPGAKENLVKSLNQLKESAAARNKISVETAKIIQSGFGIDVRTAPADASAPASSPSPAASPMLAGHPDVTGASDELDRILPPQGPH